MRSVPPGGAARLLSHSRMRKGGSVSLQQTESLLSVRADVRNRQKLVCFVGKSKTSVGPKFNERYVSSVGGRWKISMFRRLPRADDVFKKKTAAATSGSLSGTVVADIHVSVPALWNGSSTCTAMSPRHTVPPGGAAPQSSSRSCMRKGGHRATRRRRTTIVA
jgi:hypothetical protein